MLTGWMSYARHFSSCSTDVYPQQIARSGDEFQFQFDAHWVCCTTTGITQAIDEKSAATPINDPNTSGSSRQIHQARRNSLTAINTSAMS